MGYINYLFINMPPKCSRFLSLFKGKEEKCFIYNPLEMSRGVRTERKILSLIYIYLVSHSFF